MTLITNAMKTGRTLSAAETAICNYLGLVRAWVEKGIADLPADSPKREASEELLRQIHLLDSPINFNTATVDDLDQRLKLAWMFLAWENPKEVIDEIVRHNRSANARAAVEAKYNQPGGYRSKNIKIREKWASGKYLSKNECAKQECDALGMSYSSARKALIKAPAPPVRLKPTKA